MDDWMETLPKRSEVLATRSTSFRIIGLPHFHSVALKFLDPCCSEKLFLFLMRLFLGCIDAELIKSCLCQEKTNPVALRPTTK